VRAYGQVSPRFERRLTLRSSGPPPARHLARETLQVIIRLAGQAPSRRRPPSAQTLGLRSHSDATRPSFRVGAR